MPGKGKPFKKGDPRAGRKPGSTNIMTRRFDALMDDLEGQHAEEFNKTMGQLWNGTPADRLVASNLYLKILEFKRGKINRTQITGEDGNELLIKFVQGAKPGS